MMNDLTSNLHNFYTGEVRIRNNQFDKFEMLNPLHLGVYPYNQIQEKLETVEGLDSYSPRIRYPSQINKVGDQDEKVNGQGLGIDLALPNMGTEELALGVDLAKKLQVKEGDKVTLHFIRNRRGPAADTMLVVGILGFPVPGLNKATFITPKKVGCSICGKDIDQIAEETFNLIMDYIKDESKNN